MTCNCEYCVKCDRCGHKADEHWGGDSLCCYIGCNCHQFTSAAVDAWDKLVMTEQRKTSFKEFVDKWVIDEKR